MERQEPTDESLDAYVEAIERGIVLVHGSKHKRSLFGTKSEVKRLGKALSEPYLRILDYDSGHVRLDSLEGTMEDVVEGENEAEIEVDVEKAHHVAEKVEKALNRLYSDSKGVRLLTTNLAYYREGLLAGVYGFLSSEATLAFSLYRMANFSVSEGFSLVGKASSAIEGVRAVYSALKPKKPVKEKTYSLRELRRQSSQWATRERLKWKAENKAALQAGYREMMAQ